MENKKIKDYKIACIERDRIITKQDLEIESLKKEIQHKTGPTEEEILKKTKLTEEEVKIVYNEYPKLLKELKEREKRLDEGKIGELNRFIQRNTSNQGYIKSRGLLTELRRLLKKEDA